MLQYLFVAGAFVFYVLHLVALVAVVALRWDFYAFFEWEFEAIASDVNVELVNFRKYRYLSHHLKVTLI